MVACKPKCALKVSRRLQSILQCTVMSLMVLTGDDMIAPRGWGEDDVGTSRSALWPLSPLTLLKLYFSYE